MKKMKFWFDKGEEEVFDTVLSMLKNKGCSIDENLTGYINHPRNSPIGICVDKDGMATAACRNKDNGYWFDDMRDYEEINIDWMREDPATIEWQGDVYLEKDFLVALSKLKRLK